MLNLAFAWKESLFESLKKNTFALTVLSQLYLAYVTGSTVASAVSVSVRVCVSVCVCVRERKRDRRGCEDGKTFLVSAT